MKCPVSCLGTRTDEITSLHHNYQCIAVALYLQTLASLTSSPTLVTMLAKRTHTSRNITAGTLACIVTRRRYRSAQYVSQCYNKMFWQSLDTDRDEICSCLQYDCLLNSTLQWLLQFWRKNVILSVQVLVKAVGVELLRWAALRLRSFSGAPCSSADTA